MSMWSVWEIDADLKDKSLSTPGRKPLRNRSIHTVDRPSLAAPDRLQGALTVNQSDVT